METIETDMSGEDLFQKKITYVVKRDGRLEEVDLGKCQTRFKNLCKLFNKYSKY